MKPLAGSLLLLLAVALVNCSPDRKAALRVQIPPDSVIPEPSMVLLLADVHLIEAEILIARNRGTSTPEMTVYYYSGLFRKYGISRERYQQNLEYYRDDPDTFIRLYAKVNHELEKREKDFVKSRPD